MLSKDVHDQHQQRARDHQSADAMRNVNPNLRKRYFDGRGNKARRIVEGLSQALLIDLLKFIGRRRRESFSVDEREIGHGQPGVIVAHHCAGDELGVDDGACDDAEANHS